jgi:hypothetical protein
MAAGSIEASPRPISEIEAACQSSMDQQRGAINRVESVARILHDYSDRVDGTQPTTGAEGIDSGVPESLCGQVNGTAARLLQAVEILEVAVDRVLR